MANHFVAISCGRHFRTDGRTSLATRTPMTATESCPSHGTSRIQMEREQAKAILPLRVFLGSYAHLLARVGHHFVGLALRRYAGAVVLSHKHNLKAALREHSGKSSPAFTDGQGLLPIVPVKRDCRVYPL